MRRVPPRGLHPLPRPRVGRARHRPLPAAELDRLLHDERWDPRRRTRRLHAYAWDDVPDGAYVLLGSGPAVVAGDGLLPLAGRQHVCRVAGRAAPRRPGGR